MKNAELVALAIGGIALWMLMVSRQARAESPKQTPMSATGANATIFAGLLAPKGDVRTSEQIAFAKSLGDTAYI